MNKGPRDCSRITLTSKRDRSHWWFKGFGQKSTVFTVLAKTFRSRMAGFLNSEIRLSFYVSNVGSSFLTLRGMSYDYEKF